MEIKILPLICLLLFSSMCGVLLSPEMSADEFVSQANELYGEPSWNHGTWTVLKIDDYTSYSNEMWDTHPIIYTRNGMYTVFELGDQNGR